MDLLKVSILFGFRPRAVCCQVIPTAVEGSLQLTTKLGIDLIQLNFSIANLKDVSTTLDMTVGAVSELDEI